MKRLLAVLLAVCMVLSFCGCGAGETEKALEEARALIDDGEYEEAIDLLTGLEDYSRITDLILEAEEELEKEEQEKRLKDADFLMGTWRCIDQEDAAVTFLEDGTCRVNMYGDEFTGPFMLEGDILNCPVDIMTVTQYQGVPCLVTENMAYFLGEEEFGCRFVREADYEKLAPRAVEITMENWETYFELRYVQNFGRDAFGDITSVGFGYGVYLKEEYLDKVYHGYPNMDLAFKLECQAGYRYVTNPTQPDYVMGGIPPYHSFSPETVTGSLYDNRFSTYYQEDDPEYGAVYAHLDWGTLPLDEYDYFPVSEDGKITAVEGYIILYP